MSSESGTHEAFYVASFQDQLRGGHSGVFNIVSAATPDDEWFHAALTYDATDEIMRLYIDGELVDEAEGVSQRTLGEPEIFAYQSGNAWSGRADDPRYYIRALTATEISRLYKKTKI